MSSLQDERRSFLQIYIACFTYNRKPIDVRYRSKTRVLDNFRVVLSVEADRMASDSNIDRAIGRLATSSSTSPASTSRRRQDQGRPAGQLHIHGRTRSLSISSRASGFSHEELVRPALNYADDQGQSEPS